MAKIGRIALCVLLVFGCRKWTDAQAVRGPHPQAAQEPSEIRLGESYVPLYGPWKFSIGDSPINPATGKPLWAEPSFDDSNWETVDLRPAAGAVDPTGGQTGYVPGWTAKGHPGYSGFAWYRTRIRMAAGQYDKLALAGPNDIDDAYQIYWNGRLYEGFGDFNAHPPATFNAQPAYFPVLTADARDTSAQTIAFRVWMDSSTLIDTPDAGGLHTAPQLGDAATVTAVYRNHWLELIQGVALNPVQAALFLLLSLTCFSLIVFDRSDRVYLWMGAGLLALSFSSLTVLLGSVTQWMSIRTESILVYVIYAPIADAVWVMVWRSWFGFRRPLWLPRLVVAMALLMATAHVFGLSLFPGVIPGSVDAFFFDVSIAVRLAFTAINLTIVGYAIRRRGMEGWLVLVPILLGGVSQFEVELSGLGVRLDWFPFGTAVSLSFVTRVCQIVVLALLLFRRVYRSVAEQRSRALDIKQAQEVQQMIVPEDIVEHFGLTIESVFRPAREVGGDFFQVLPHPTDGGLLIVAGDVAGKGLQAGMLVALLVGAIRTALETSYDPARVISVLNRRLVGRVQGATTCLALHIAADGAVKLANAGHLPPYLNGEPLPMEGALPLGIFDGAEPSSMRFKLEPGDQMVLISDGILEAMNPHGELFGFERIAAELHRKSNAGALADAAQKFGQEDDISVISITRQAAPVVAVATERVRSEAV